ncbi:MAG: adenylosuccinate synthetase [Aggregatilineales bacterium]
MKASTRQAFIVVDLGYGDAGKGTMVDYLTRKHNAHTVIRFNGGAQAAHNVVTTQGQHHTFSQFGSGTFVSGVRTYLSRYMLIEPYALFNEEEHLQQLGITDAFSRLSIDRAAPVTTLYHQAANRLKERARGDNRHGSCGVGIGETVADLLEHGQSVLFAGDLPDKQTTIKKLRFLRNAKWEALREIRHQLKGDPDAYDDLQIFTDDDLINIAADNYQYLIELVTLTDDSNMKNLFEQSGTLIFEGAQGVLLDENYGFAPYTTWSTTTPKNAETLLNETNYSGEITRLGVVRSYMTRHGAGPFVTEDPTLRKRLPELHNATSDWQQSFRVGYFDSVAHRYALNVAKTIDTVAITHVDRLAALPHIQICDSYITPAPQEKIDAYFVLADGTRSTIISNIKVQSMPTFSHQNELARSLIDCKPMYTAIPHGERESDIESTIEYIEQRLNIPVTMTSTGMTAQHKFERESNFKSKHTL